MTGNLVRDKTTHRRNVATPDRVGTVCAGPDTKLLRIQYLSHCLPAAVVLLTGREKYPNGKSGFSIVRRPGGAHAL
jgi:hypothetical protein